MDNGGGCGLWVAMEVAGFFFFFFVCSGVYYFIVIDILFYCVES